MLMQEPLVLVGLGMLEFLVLPTLKRRVKLPSWPIESSYMALSEHLKLSILIGRVLKTIYSPTGLKNTTDEQLHSILTDMTSWMDNLPEELRFNGPTSSLHSGELT